MKLDRMRIRSASLNRWVLICCLLCSFRDSSWNIKPTGRISAPAILEASGVVVSRQFKDVLWVHNDSRRPPEIFAITERGKLIRSYLLPGAENRDWEDIALGLDNNLYILDNTSRLDPEHRNIVYILPEPNPFKDEQVIAPRKIWIGFPEGGFDCETIFVWQGKIYLVTKPWDGTMPRIYRCDDLQKGGLATFVGTVPVYTMVTGGDISVNASRVALLSYRALMIFEGTGSPEELLQSEPSISLVNAGQVEGVSWKGDRVVLTNEQGEIFRVSRSRWKRHEAPFLETPETTVPFVSQRPSIGQTLRRWRRGRWLQVERMGKETKIGRIVWTTDGLHIGINLPEKTRLRFLGPEPPPDFDDWFEPGSVYVMINPSGARPLAFEERDRCITVGRSADGSLITRARYLRPGTFVHSTERLPAWIQMEEEGQRLLLTLTAETPGLEELSRGQKIGFNLLLIGADGELVSWAPIAMRFSWDSPSIWGLLNLR